MKDKVKRLMLNIILAEVNYMKAFFKCRCGTVVEEGSPGYDRYIADGEILCIKCKEKFLHRLGKRIAFIFGAKKEERGIWFGKDK